MKQFWGNQLSAEVQRQALGAFVHRFTKEHKPRWAAAPRPDDMAPYPVQFASDRDWLDNTLFWVTSRGTLSRVHRHCESFPTWPDHPGLREVVSRRGQTVAPLASEGR